MLAQFIYWVHVAAILLAIGSGYFLPPFLVLVLIIAHRVHLKVLDDCMLTSLHRKTKTIPANMNFLQYFVGHTFGKAITKKQASNINYGNYAVTLLLSVLPF